MITPQLIREVDLFRDLAEAEAQELVRLAAVETHQKGDVIFREKDIANKIYLIESGVVDIGRQGRDGTGFTMHARLERGEIFGETALADEGPRSACAMASLVPETKLVVWNCGDLKKAFEAFPALEARILRNMMKRIFRRMRMMSETIQAMAKTNERDS